MQAKYIIKCAALMAGVGIVVATVLNFVTTSVSLPLPADSVTVHRSVMSDIVVATEALSLNGSVRLSNGRFAINEFGVRAELSIPKGGSIATLRADQLAVDASSMPNSMVRLKLLPSQATVTFSPAIRLTIATGAVIDLESVSLNETNRSVEAQIKLAIARSLYNISTSHAIAEPDANLGGIAFAAKIIDRIQVDRLACTFKQGSEIRLTEDQVLVVGAAGSAQLFGLTIAGLDNIAGSFKLNLPLVTGSCFTASDFIVKPESGRLSVAGTYSRKSGVEDLRLGAEDKGEFLAMKGVIKLKGKPVVRVDSLTMPSGEFAVHQAKGVRQITLGGSGSLNAEVADAAFLGGGFTLSGFKSQFAFTLTTDGKTPTFNGAIESASTESWRVHVGSDAASKVEFGGSNLKFQNVTFSKLGAVTLSLPAGEVRPTTVAFSNKRCSVAVVLDRNSTIAFTGQLPILFGLGGTSGITIGDVQITGRFANLAVHTAGRHLSAKDCSGSLRLATAGKLRAMGQFQMTVNGTSISRSLDQALGHPSQFNINELKVTGLSCSSDDATLNCAFDLSDASDGSASVKIRVPNGFRVNVTGSGLRDSQLDASFVGRGFEAEVDLDRGETRTTLEFDLVNRRRVSPLTIHTDVPTSPWSQFTARAWIFVKPCTVSLRAGATIRLAGDGRMTLRFDSWQATDLNQGIPLDSDTKKMPGVHGIIRPISADRIKIHANYIGDFWFANPVPKALNSLIGREIVLRN